MSSTNKTSLGLNLWEASDKPVRQDFVNDNTIIDEKITKINSNLDNVNSNLANYIPYSHIVNNGSTTASGYALDARYGKSLIQEINTVKSNIETDLTEGLKIVDTNYFSLASWTSNGIERRGHVVHFHCHFTVMKQLTDWNEHTLVQLPELYRTTYNFNGEKYIGYAGKLHLFQYFVHTSGVIGIKVDNAAPIGAECTLDFTYFAK
ncbi:MAG: hypothetical protein E7248_04625 [Paenibacillaceae bacterium]|nr:hypothetical protein [Paenibacillaceae bacterium]